MVIKVKIDDRIRLTASVLLLTKFVDENRGWEPHRLKVETLEYLRPHRDHPCTAASREISESAWMSAFYCYSVLLRRTDLGFEFNENALPSGYSADFLGQFRGYDHLLSTFFTAAEMSSFWAATADGWHEVVNDCEACLQQCAVSEFLELFFGVLPYRLVFVPNPLDPPTFGFGPNDGSTAYCIYGPPTVQPGSEREVKYSLYGRHLAYAAFHEFGHSLLAHALRRYPQIVEQTRHLGERMALRGWFPQMYKGWDMQFQEVFLRAAEALWREQLEGPEAARRMLEQQKADFGIDLVDQVFGCLRGYLAARRRREYEDLSAYLPVLAEQLGAK